MADIDPVMPMSLVGLTSLRAELTDLLGVQADLVQRAVLSPAVRATADRDAIRVL
jgi:predicted nucleotidyltransferase